MECVVIMTELFFLYVDIFDTMFHMNLLAYGSTPVDGSSRKIRGGLPTIAIDTESFLLLPPERVEACTFTKSLRSMSSISLLINLSLNYFLIPFIEE